MSKEIRERFADRLQRLRKEQGMSQQTVATVLNISRPAYTYYETGKASPSLEMLRRLNLLFCPSAPQYLLVLDEPSEQEVLCEKNQDCEGELPLFRELTAREQTALGMFRVMDKKKKEQALLLLSRLLNEEQEAPPKDKKKRSK